MNEELARFVDHARDKGMDHGTIRQLLLSHGWKDKEIADVFCTRELELPIPQPPARHTAHAPSGRRPGESVWPRRVKDAFLHLLTFAALLVTTFTLILLFFIYIDFALPDPAMRVSSASLQERLSVVRGAIAVLVVVFPMFLILWNHLLREVQRHPDRGAIRRSLGYVSISLFSLALAGDVVALIFLFLEGQLTTRLLLQAIVLLLIAGSLVCYLLLTLRSESETGNAR